MAHSLSSLHQVSETVRPHLQAFIEYTRNLRLERVEYADRDILLQEGTKNQQLYIILEGRVVLTRLRPDGQRTVIDTLKPGSFLGLLSFWSDEPTFTQSRAMGKVTCLRFNLAQIQEVFITHPQASLALSGLLINSLADRYRSMVMLNLAVQRLTDQLEAEGTRLRATVRDLEETRNRLIHKERLALLGQLLGGIAHEVNNPLAALNQSVEDLGREADALFEKGGALEKMDREARLLRAGLASQFLGSDVVRERLAALQEQFPEMDRPFLRKLVPLQGEVWAELQPELNKARRQDGLRARILEKVRFFQIGAHLNSIRLVTQRIARLMGSLKAYVRPVTESAEPLALRDCIQDTLTVLHHKLKKFRVNVEMDSLPDNFKCPARFNQVLSNVLINAAEATPEGGEIRLSAWADLEEGSVRLTVDDTGTGIHPSLLEKIFEPDVTTKSSGGQFGLGLGLAISREIMERYGGSIRAENRPEGGARFVMVLPPM